MGCSIEEILGFVFCFVSVWGSMLIVTSEFMQDVVAIKSIFVKCDETGIFLNGEHLQRNEANDVMKIHNATTRERKIQTN